MPGNVLKTLHAISFHSYYYPYETVTIILILQVKKDQTGK